jgi:hypothetical protein
MQARPASNIKCILLIQVASKVQDAGGGRYSTRSYSFSQAQEAGPTGLHIVQTGGKRGLSLMSEYHSHTIRVKQPLADWQSMTGVGNATHAARISSYTGHFNTKKELQVLNVRTRSSLARTVWRIARVASTPERSRHKHASLGTFWTAPLLNL